MTAEERALEIIEKYKDSLKENDLTGFYRALVEDKNIFGTHISEVTQYFYKMGADPLEYLDEIPIYFLCDSDIESFTIPDNITEIGYDAFNGCKNLKSIVIPEGVTEIDDGTFIDCRNLTSVKLPDTVEYIGDYAFANCENLTDINVPKNLEKIAWSAFDGCPQETYRKFREFIQ